MLIGAELADGILYADQIDEAGIIEQRDTRCELKEHVQELLIVTMTKLCQFKALLQNLLSMADVLVKKSVWIIGGDGWAYDIGYGGLGSCFGIWPQCQCAWSWIQKFTPIPVAKCQKLPHVGPLLSLLPLVNHLPKKDLGLLAISYGNIYVARIAFGANDRQTIRAIMEAEAYDGPSLDHRLQLLALPMVTIWNMVSSSKKRLSSLAIGHCIATIQNWPNEGKNPFALGFTQAAAATRKIHLS